MDYYRNEFCYNVRFDYFYSYIVCGNSKANAYTFIRENYGCNNCGIQLFTTDWASPLWNRL